ncbi:unnamed protein product [Rhizophagus irregularis]|nr:unnamed protein product [Rhizophagus irregularis]CAB5363683.1 unnamed protein product [Rhizophagus irregularis]
MFYSKTILHGIAFICVHSFPIIMGVSIFYTQDNVCSDIPKNCIFPKGSIYYISAVLLLSFLLIVTAFYCLILYHLWSRKLWPLRYEYPYTKREDIIEMDSVYQLQFPIFHAKIMMISLWSIFYTILIWGMGILGRILRKLGIASYLIPLNIFVLFYTYSMLKGVRDESRRLMFILYIGNICQAILLYLGTIDYCHVILHKSVRYCFKYSPFFDTFFVISVISWILLILSILNSIRCQGNFKKGLGFYLRYEPTPDEFKVENTLKKRESTPADFDL